ncbi:inositol monophosphatase family protein [Halomonas sp. WWR20]
MQSSERLAEAVRIAELAGQRIIEARQSQDFTHHYKAGSELVTETDIAVDKLIASELDKQFSGEARLTEELSPERDTLHKDGPLWIVDPIDGTVNFAYGHPHVAVSIAWAKDGKVRLGVVHAPFLGETYTAIRGEGASLNGKPIRTAEVKELTYSLVGTGFPYRRDGRTPLLRRLTAVLNQCRDIRRNGSAALDLCNVACGRLDAYYESVSPWDFAAGLLISREAGARTGHLYDVPDHMPADLYGENLLVASANIYTPLRELLKRADAGQLDAPSADDLS